MNILKAQSDIFSIFANLTIFLRMFNCDFWNANLGYLQTFLRGMLESKLAQNNLNFKCSIKFFCQNWSSPLKGGSSKIIFARELKGIIHVFFLLLIYHWGIYMELKNTQEKILTPSWRPKSPIMLNNLRPNFVCPRKILHFE